MYVTGESLYCLLSQKGDHWLFDVAVWKGEGQKNALTFPMKPGQSRSDVESKMRALILLYLNSPDKSANPFEKRIAEETNREMTEYLWAFWPGFASSPTGNHHMFMQKQDDGMWKEIEKPDNWLSTWEYEEMLRHEKAKAQREERTQLTKPAKEEPVKAKKEPAKTKAKAVKVEDKPSKPIEEPILPEEKEIPLSAHEPIPSDDESPEVDIDPNQVGIFDEADPNQISLF